MMLKTPLNKDTALKAGTALLALAVLFLSACAATQSGEHAVVKRAEARWDAMVSKEIEEAYPYYSPGYRSANSLIDLGVVTRMRRIQWTSAEYVSHNCEESRCTVRFRIGFRVSNPVPGLKVYDGTEVVEDTWIKSQGQWWYLPNK